MIFCNSMASQLFWFVPLEYATFSGLLPPKSSRLSIYEPARRYLVEWSQSGFLESLNFSFTAILFGLVLQFLEIGWL